MKWPDWTSFVAATATIGGFLVLLYLRQYLRERALAKQRVHATSASFLDYFRDQPVSQDLCLKVYTQLPRFQTLVGRFPVLPTDDLAKIYGVTPVSGGLEDLLDEMIPACGIPFPSKEQLAQAAKQVPRINTVADLVRLLAIIERLSLPVRELDDTKT